MAIMMWYVSHQESENMPMGAIQVISKQKEFTSLYELTLLFKCKNKRIRKIESIDVKKLFDGEGMLAKSEVEEFVNSALKGSSFKSK
jgi:hypothetical protein